MNEPDKKYIQRFLEMNGYTAEEYQQNGSICLKKNDITVTSFDEQICFELGKSVEVDDFGESNDCGSFAFDANILFYASVYCVTHNLHKIEKALYSSLNNLGI